MLLVHRVSIRQSKWLNCVHNVDQVPKVQTPRRILVHIFMSTCHARSKDHPQWNVQTNVKYQWNISLMVEINLISWQTFINKICSSNTILLVVSQHPSHLNVAQVPYTPRFSHKTILLSLESSVRIEKSICWLEKHNWDGKSSRLYMFSRQVKQMNCTSKFVNNRMPRRNCKAQMLLWSINWEFLKLRLCRKTKCSMSFSVRLQLRVKWSKNSHSKTVTTCMVSKMSFNLSRIKYCPCKRKLILSKWKWQTKKNSGLL